MKTYFLIFSVATFSSLALTPIIRRLCQRFSWLDEPVDGRRLHKIAIPRLGGVAIFFSMLLGIVPLLLIHNLFTDSLRGAASRFLVILVPAFLTLALGVYDDLYGLNARRKFAGLAAIGVIFFFMGGRIQHLSIPFVGSLKLPLVLGLVLTVMWVVIITNAFNLLDGIDGLATGAGIFSSVVIMSVALTLHRPSVIALALVFSGALIGFLRYNFNPASIFLGDSGALLVGFMLAALSVEGSQKASTAVAVSIPIISFGLPLVDTGFTIVRRFISRKPLFEGDREHIHHMLLERGWSQRRTALVLYGVCALFGLLTLLFVSNAGNVTALVLVIVGVAAVFLVGHLRYPEVDELKASVKRNLGDRRIRGANNVRVRRATRNVAKANTLPALLEAVVEVLEIGEFAGAVMIVGRDGEADSNAALLAREQSASVLSHARMKEDRIYWCWTRENIELAELNTSENLWAIRLPLIKGKGVLGHLNLYREIGREHVLLDINYLCTMFHEEMTKAVARVLGTSAAAQSQSTPAAAASAKAGASTGGRLPAPTFGLSLSKETNIKSEPPEKF